jgi:hypothetical protein
MRDFIRNHKTLAAAVGLPACFLLVLALLVNLWQVSASTRGRLAARHDISRAHYQILGYGLPPPCREKYARLLRERYGIQFRVVAFCVVSESLRSYADAYDDVSSAAATRKFGHDVFKECWEEAQKTCERGAPMAKKD